MTSAEVWFNIALRPRKPEGSLGRKAQDSHLESHTAEHNDGWSKLLVGYFFRFPLRMVTWFLCKRDVRGQDDREGGRGRWREGEREIKL